MFHENWYSDPQIKLLSETVRSVNDLEGKIIEIGCWEGKSTIALANSIYPQMLDAVDTWEGNVDEDKNHESVILARKRDVFAEFQKNIKEATKQNVNIHKMDCFVFLSTLQGRVKFCHIDASHDYTSVKRTIDLLFPKLIPGGILCGDDYATAHSGRADLQGGVQKAVMEMCPGHKAVNNFWWYKKD